MTEILKLIIDKLSQYNFLTNIIPGSVLCIIFEYIVGMEIIPDSAYQAGIVFYFAGLVTGRFGSLFIEWFLKKIKVVKFAPYADFVEAEKRDAKITTLSQENNTYRAYISVCFLSILIWIYRIIVDCPNCKTIIGVSLLLLSLLVLFIFAYRKQTRYVRRRVEKNIASTSAH